jgi:hypothetical protein
MPTGAGGVPPDLLIELLRLVQDTARSRQKRVSRRREFDTFGAAHEKRHVKGLLEIGESLTYRGRNRVTAFSRPRDAAGLRDRDKLLEITEIKVQDA